MGLLDIENIITPINSFEQIEELGFMLCTRYRGMSGRYELKIQFACKPIRFTVRYYLENQLIDGVDRELHGFAIIENVSIRASVRDLWFHSDISHNPIKFSISTIESLQFILSANWFVQTFTNMLDDKKVFCSELVKLIFRNNSHNIH